MYQRMLAKSCFLLTFANLLILPSLLLGQSAERPNSAEILPETTVVYVQLKDAREFAEKIQETNMGKFIADERVAPLVGDLYATAQDAYAEVEERVGLSLDEIQSLPAGEICFAVVAPKRKDPAFVLMIDTDEESETVAKVLERGRDLASENDVELELDELDDVTYEKFSIDGQPIMFFEKGGTIVVGTNQDVLDDMVERWMGREVDKIKPLKENRKFITIMNRCRSSKDLPADLRFFVDPLGLAKSATRGQAGAQFALNMLPILGLDGLLGIGGASIMDEMDFESVSHLHILLSNPRSGILDMLALKPGTYEPQNWIPDKTVTYASTSWDVQKMFSEIEKLFDQFNGEGAMAEEIEDEINSELNIDFREDVINQLAGRLTYVQWVDDDQEVINGQTNAIAIELKDGDAFRDTVDIFIEKIQGEDADDIEEAEHKGVTYWKMPDERWESQMERQKEQRERRREQGRGGPQMEFRMPQPSFAILEDHLIFCIESPAFIHQAIEASRGDAEPLFDEEKFKYATDQMTKLLRSDTPCAIVYSNPQESMRWLMRVAQSDGTNEFMDEIANENEYAMRIRDAMKDNPLPDFEDVKDYFQPSGMFITNDDTGYHFLGFQLKSTVDE